jgi:kynurenine formamidase
MKATLHFASGDVVIDLTQAIDLSTRLDFHGDQPSAFGLPRAWAAAFRAGGFVGDTREGGSVNCETVTLNPHGNGTHTECVGHICDERVFVADILQDVFARAWVVSVHPEPIGTANETYPAPHADTDIVVTAKALRAAIGEANLNGCALVVRTLPNPGAKRHAHFSGNQPTYFSHDAMHVIHQAGVKHLLVDFPSVDREEDGGLLPNHHTFWDVPQGTHHFVNVPSSRTITEMVFVPDDVPNGWGVVSIQIPDFAQDAAPSRPRFFLEV